MKAITSNLRRSNFGFDAVFPARGADYFRQWYRRTSVLPPRSRGVASSD